MQKGKVLAPSLKGDMHLLESNVLFSKCLWRVEWVLGLFHCYSWATGVETCFLSGKGLQSDFSLVSIGILVFNLRQHSPVPLLKYVSLHWLSFWCDARWVSFLSEIHELCAVLALCGIHQSHPKKNPLFLGTEVLKSHKCAYVGEIPISAIHLISGCQLPHLFGCINNASPWGWLLSLEFAVCKCFSILMNSVIKVPLAGPVLSSPWLRKK